MLILPGVTVDAFDEPSARDGIDREPVGAVHDLSSSAAGRGARVGPMIRGRRGRVKTPVTVVAVSTEPRGDEESATPGRTCSTR
jgi:hypothetical protein